jgi:hypothetical protein
MDIFNRRKPGRIIIVAKKVLIQAFCIEAKQPRNLYNIIPAVAERLTPATPANAPLPPIYTR